MKNTTFTIVIILLAFNCSAIGKFQKTKKFTKVEKYSFDIGNKKTEFDFVDYGPGITFKHRLTLNKAKAIKYVHNMMNDSTECAKLIKNGPNVINVFNGVVIIEYNSAVDAWTIDYKDRLKVVGDDTRPVRYFINAEQKKAIFKETIATL